MVSFYLLDKIKIKRELPPLNRVEEFKIENRLKPVGLILTMHSDTLKIYNFDEELSKKTNSCACIASVRFKDCPKLLTLTVA